LSGKGREKEVSAQKVLLPPSLGQWITVQLCLLREEMWEKTQLFFPNISARAALPAINISLISPEYLCTLAWFIRLNKLCSANT